MDKFQSELLAQLKEHNRLMKELVKIERANFELSKNINDVNSSLADVIKATKDGEETKWNLVSDGLPEDGTWNIWQSKTGKLSIERYKEDAFDHFYPNGRFFNLEDAIAWMPLPERYTMTKGDEEDV